MKHLKLITTALLLLAGMILGLAAHFFFIGEYLASVLLLPAFILLCSNVYFLNKFSLYKEIADIHSRMIIDDFHESVERTLQNDDFTVDDMTIKETPSPE